MTHPRALVLFFFLVGAMIGMQDNMRKGLTEETFDSTSPAEVPPPAQPRWAVTGRGFR